LNVDRPDRTDQNLMHCGGLVLTHVIAAVVAAGIAAIAHPSRMTLG